MNNLKFNKHVLFTLIGGVLALSACKKNKNQPEQEFGTTGIYVLCEGNFTETAGINNSSITYFDIATSIPQKDYFKTKNGIELGTNASDLKQYGSKMYCVISGTKAVNKDSYLEVMNIATGKSLKRIPFSDGTGGFLPRYVSFHQGKVYVSGYDGYISKVDTASLNIEARIKVGGALEQLTIVNNKLYVTNSAHFQLGTANNSSVSVVDLNTFTKLYDIPVGFNPTRISATNSGDIFVVTKGNYVDVPASLDKVSSVTDKKVSSNVVSLEYLNITGTKGFVIGDYMDPYFKTLDISNGTINGNFVADDTKVLTPYGVTVNSLDNNIFVADGNGYAAEGKFFCFSPVGKKFFQFATGPLPQSAVFKYGYK